MERGGGAQRGKIKAKEETESKERGDDKQEQNCEGENKGNAAAALGDSKKC